MWLLPGWVRVHLAAAWNGLPSAAARHPVSSTCIPPQRPLHTLLNAHIASCLQAIFLKECDVYSYKSDLETDPFGGCRRVPWYSVGYRWLSQLGFPPEGWMRAGGGRETRVRDRGGSLAGWGCSPKPPAPILCCGPGRVVRSGGRKPSASAMLQEERLGGVMGLRQQTSYGPAQIQCP